MAHALVFSRLFITISDTIHLFDPSRHLSNRRGDKGFRVQYSVLLGTQWPSTAGATPLSWSSIRLIPSGTYLYIAQLYLTSYRHPLEEVDPVLCIHPSRSAIRHSVKLP